MKEFKGTQGPWTVNSYYNWIESENADKVVIGGSQGFDPDDANLIAAAPDLLQALQFIINDCSRMIPKCAEEKAIAAINKALGE